MTEHIQLLPPGAPIGDDGRYTVMSVLGQGGFSIAYLAQDTMLEIEVVIKEFFPKDLAVRADGTVRPLEEAAAPVYASRLEHFCAEAKLLTSLTGTEGIPVIKDAFRANGTAYIVTEYIPGVTLAEYLADKGGQLGWIKTSSVLLPVAYALQSLHSKGIIHKDVSPSNILVTNRGGILLDFGSAVSPERTLKHGYAPLELYSANAPASPSTDVYSLAATAYKCLTGITPAQATDRVINDTLQPPTSAGSDIMAEAETLLIKALAVRPSDRLLSDEDIIKLFEMRPVAKTSVKVSAKANVATLAAIPDGPTIVLRQEYTPAGGPDGEITIVMDCSKLHEYSAPHAVPPLENVIDTEKASKALKESGEKLGKAAELAGQQLGKAAGQAGEKISEAIKSNPSKFKKIAAVAVALLVILVGGYTYYNNVYLNSFGVQYGKSLDMYDDGDYRDSFWQLNRTVELHPDPNEKQIKDLNYLMVLLLFKGYPIEDDVPLGTVPQPDDYIEFSMKLADAGDMRHMTMLAELCFMGSLERHEMFFKDIGFDRLKKYADTIAEKNPDYKYLSDLNDNVSQRLFIIAMDKLDKSILDEAIVYMKKSGASDSECARARKKYEGMIQWHLDDRQAKKEIEERKRKQREEEKKAQLEHEAWLREQKEKDRIAAEQNRKAREERKRQEAAAKKTNQQKQQKVQKKSQPATKSTAKPKTTVPKQQPKAQQTQRSGRLTLAQKAALIRKAMAQRDAAEQARLRQRAEQEAASKGISVNDALMILLGIGR